MLTFYHTLISSSLDLEGTVSRDFFVPLLPDCFSSFMIDLRLKCRFLPSLSPIKSNSISSAVLSASNISNLAALDSNSCPSHSSYILLAVSAESAHSATA